MFVQTLLAALGAAASAILFGFLLFILGVRLLHINQALPGVHAGGLDVSGMNREEIEWGLGQRLTYSQDGLIVLTDRGQRWVARPQEVGVIVDAPSMAQRALDVGRTGGPLSRVDAQLLAWTEGIHIPPLVRFDQRAGKDYLQTLALEIDRPTIEARLQVEDTDVVHTPGQVGRQVDLAATLEALTPAVERMHDAQIELVVREVPPIVLDASSTEARADSVLSEPFQLAAEGVTLASLGPGQLAEMIRFEPMADEGRYQIQLDPGTLRQRMEPLAPDLQRDPQNARFIFNDDTRELDLHEAAVIGRELDLRGSLAAIEKAVASGQHGAELVFHTEDPAVTSDATAEELGITENVTAVSTYFSGSSEARKQNIETAASAFHGLLVAPGETLSMAEVLGDISLDKGYAEALIIYGDRTIKGVGGGVCQVSTTLFRAAFFGGYQIEERHPHAYRVLYYEQGPNSPGPGFDATVFVPLVDFRFTNDTENWLLLETYIYGDQLLWKFYSGSDGRSVEWNSSGPQDVEEAPEPLYKENPDLEEGEIEQVDFEADGMDLRVTRTVRRDGEMLHDDLFKTHYLPWRAIYEYGPGTDLPDDAKTED